jgi:signal transduction histidine kinase
MAGIALALFYLAAGNSVLALTVGTCTQGDAGRLWGGLLSLLLYAIGAPFLRHTSKPGLALALLIPIAPVLIWQAMFAVNLTVGFWFLGRSACDALDGMTGQSADGSEPIFTAIWLAVAATSLAGVAALFANWKRINTERS